MAEHLHKTETFIIHDTNRYLTDDYAINIALQETQNGYSIGIYVTSYKVGLGGYQQYWHYKFGEKNLAQDSYDRIYAIAEKTTHEFEYENLPMAILKPRLRSRLDNLDDEHVERSGVYNYNWFVELAEKEADWRISLYGQRYPDSPTSFEVIGDTWNTNKNEQSSAIKTTGKGRNQMSSYKYAELKKEAQLELLKKWFPAVSMAALMSFLAASNLTAPELEQKLQTNPEEVRNQIPEVEPDYTFSVENVEPATQPTPEPTTQAVTDPFDDILNTTLGFEGGYANVKGDSGGETNMGITDATYDDWLGTDGNVKDITNDQMRSIYKENYWKPVGGDRLPPIVAQQMFDYGVHSGPGSAVAALQQIVGSDPDGVFGPKTLQATQQYIAKYGEQKLASTILNAREKHLIGIATGKNAKFKRGWMSRIDQLREGLGEQPKEMAVQVSTQKHRAKNPPERQTQDLRTPMADFLGTLAS